MAMLQLQPDQIAVFWDSIRDTMLQSNTVPGDKKEQYLNLTLEKCLSGKLACWIVYEQKEDKKELHTMLLTAITEDRLFGFRYVRIEGIYGYRQLKEEMILEIGNKLVVYAKNVNCKAIRAQTKNQRAMELCENNGAVNMGTVYSLEV